MTVRLWRTTLVTTALLLAVQPRAPHAIAGPYEIRAEWTDDTHRLTPAGVDFAFDAIEYVPRLGVMVYGDHLLLRIEHGEPFVTLGIAPSQDDVPPVRYGSAALLADGGRLITRTSVRSEKGGARIRETRVVRFDADEAVEREFRFPPPSEGTAWTSIRLFTDADGQVFAYAGRGRPAAVTDAREDVRPALEQRFYRLAGGERVGWEELAPLDTALVSATDACFVDRSLVVVGSRIEKDADGKVTVRRGVAAELAAGRWFVSKLPPPSGAAAWSMAGLRCGRTRDRIYALAVTPAPGQPIGKRNLTGEASLYRFDGSKWQPLSLPASEADASGDAPRVTAFTLDRNGALWLSYASDGNERSASLHRYDGGVWTPVPLPRVPEVAFYSLTGLAFDDDGNGWAIANRNGNSTVPESHGILLGYDGTVRDAVPASTWRLRGWRWNPLRQRWFGLLGNLR
jgi:hypothetical protein